MILVDTGPLVALFDAKDGQHARCAKTLEGIREPLVTTVPVLTEAFHMLGPESTGATQSPRRSRARRPRQRDGRPHQQRARHAAGALRAAARSAYRDVVRVCVLEPRCEAVTFWGFTDAHTWLTGDSRCSSTRSTSPSRRTSGCSTRSGGGERKSKSQPSWACVTSAGTAREAARVAPGGGVQAARRRASSASSTPASAGAPARRARSGRRAHQRQRAADMRSRGDVQHAGAVGCRSCARRRCAPCRARPAAAASSGAAACPIPACPARPAGRPAQHQHAVGVDRGRGRRARFLRSGSSSNTTAGPVCVSSRGSAALA
jgi:predicted nucleic acid-binding protein